MSDFFNPNSDHDDLPFEFHKKPVPGGLQQTNWEAVKNAIHQQNELTPKNPMRRSVVIIAVVALLITAVWMVKNNTATTDLSKINTAFGEIKHIVLPDSSVVILNANSSIRIPTNWTDKGNRQVWLEGEAYFEVTKKPAIQQKFVVHTAKVDVEVLGTRFNVNTRRQHSVVSLEEGKIQLLMRGELQSVTEKAGRRTPIRPGQVAIIDQTDHLSIHDDKEVTNRSAWTRNEFHFDHTTLTEVSRIMEEMYGYKMEAREDPSLMQRAVSGDLRAASLEEFLEVLEVIFKLKMTKENKTVLVTAVR